MKEKIYTKPLKMVLKPIKPRRYIRIEVRESDDGFIVNCPMLALSAAGDTEKEAVVVLEGKVMEEWRALRRVDGLFPGPEVRRRREQLLEFFEKRTRNGKNLR